MLRKLTMALLLVTLAAAQRGQPKAPPAAPDLPATTAIVDAMLKLAGVTAADVVYDLGSGDGLLVVAASKAYGAHGVGIDINPQRVQEATGNARKAGVEKLVRFEENDMFEADIHAATVVTLYLLPDFNKRLRAKLLRDLKPGTRVVSHSFDMGDDWKPEKAETLPGTTIYLWRVPGKR